MIMVMVCLKEREKEEIAGGSPVKGGDVTCVEGC